MENILSTLWSGFVASVVWFVAGGILYTNPYVAKIYKSYAGHPGLKKWNSQKKYMITMYLIGALIPCLAFAFVYDFMSPVLPASLLLSVVCFGLILVFIRILPRLFDMWIQSTYPNKLLAIEIINGSILSFVAALAFALMI